MQHQNWSNVHSMMGGLLGAFLLVLGVFAGAAGAFLLHNALGSPFTGVGVFDMSVEFDNGHTLLINENIACAVLLCFSAVTSTAGAMMLIFAIRHESASEDSLE